VHASTKASSIRVAPPTPTSKGTYGSFVLRLVEDTARGAHERAAAARHVLSASFCAWHVCNDHLQATAFVHV
jgi:hypothetical protein